jgi:beta-galactosidase
VLSGGEVIDGLETPFGVRSCVFDPKKGFLLNGMPIKLKGTSNHQDHGGVGVALPDRLHEFRIERLKEMGSNAWRCAHNPPAAEFLDACDRLGMVVMDETRCMNSTAAGLHQLESMILRDRNHPSVVIWSLGNEEHFHQGTETGERIIRTMKRLAKRLDPTRPITLAMNQSWGGPVSPLLDVQGINYFPDLYDDYHKRFPKQPILATENSPAFCTRGIHVNDPERCHFNSYDTRKAPKEWTHCITTEEAWKAVAQRDFIAGIFPWTGFDYRGEPAPFAWPCVSTNMGLLDLCGFPKDHFYYHQAWWTDRPVLHIFPHWNWPGREGKSIDVWCYSNCERVELFLNGASLGAQEMPRNGHLEWKVQYAPGTLLAQGFSKGKLEIESKIETTGSPASLQILADRDTIQADGRDVSIMTVWALDDAGRLVPYAGNDVAFEVTGPGRIIGTGNGDPSSHEPDKASGRRLFNGLCQLLVQSVDGQPGEIAVKARAAGLSQAGCLVTTCV